MSLKKGKNGKNVQMLQRAKDLNESELAHALGDAVRRNKYSPESADSSRSLASPGFSTKSVPEELNRGKQRRASVRSREASSSSCSSRENYSPPRKLKFAARSRRIISPSSSSERLSSDQEECQQQRRNERRSSQSGRSSWKQHSRIRTERRMSISRRVSHAKRTPRLPQSPARSNLSIMEVPNSSQLPLPTQPQPTSSTSKAYTSMQHVRNEHVTGGSKPAARFEQSNKQVHSISSQKRNPQSPNLSEERLPQDRNSKQQEQRSSNQKQNDVTGDKDGVINERRSLRVPLSTDEENTRKEIKALQKKINKLEKAKAESDDHALELSKQLEAFKGGKEYAVVPFTEVDEFPLTTADMDDLSERSRSDSMFVGLLLMAILGPERLFNVSATGQQSRRFAKKLNADGTPAYPALEAIDKKLMIFLCDKVAERNQKRLGPSKISSIRAACTEKKIRSYVTQKLSNHKRPSPPSGKGQQNEPQVTDSL